MTKNLNAEQFADLFIEDLPDTLKDYKEGDQLIFCKNTYKDDPDLKVLKKKLNAIGYDLIVCDEAPNIDLSWKLIKLVNN